MDKQFIVTQKQHDPLINQNGLRIEQKGRLTRHKMALKPSHMLQQAIPTQEGDWMWLLGCLVDVCSMFTNKSRSSETRLIFEYHERCRGVDAHTTRQKSPRAVHHCGYVRSQWRVDHSVPKRRKTNSISEIWCCFKIRKYDKEFFRRYCRVNQADLFPDKTDWRKKYIAKKTGAHRDQDLHDVNEGKIDGNYNVLGPLQSFEILDSMWTMYHRSINSLWGPKRRSR